MIANVSRFIAVLDANVLYSSIIRDALLRLARAGLFRARWSGKIIDEMRRSLIRQNPGIDARIWKLTDRMHTAFPESWVENYEPLIEGLTLPDPDDRHVLAAAVKAGAQAIVTNNLQDFPKNVLASFGIEPLSADQFMVRTVDLRPSAAMGALRRMRAGYISPPYKRNEFIDIFRRNGLIETAHLMRAEIDML